MSERVRQILRESWQTAQAKIALDKNFFGNIQDKPSNLGCLEFKCSMIDEKDLDGIVAAMKPFLDDLGVRFVSILKMTNMIVMTVTKEVAEEVKKIAKRFNLQLSKESYSSDGVEKNPLKQNDQTAPSASTKHFSDFGRSSQDGRGSAGSAGMIGGQGFPIDRLAGE